MNTAWYLYICESNAGYYYVGISPDPQTRLLKHNSGHGSKMARDQGTFKLVYISSAYDSKSSARKREIQVKGWSRDKKTETNRQDLDLIRRTSQIQLRHIELRRGFYFQSFAACNIPSKSHHSLREPVVLHPPCV
jgi:putative endonuclease